MDTHSNMVSADIYVEIVAIGITVDQSLHVMLENLFIGFPDTT